ncbi:MAG: NAD(P)/FAD-dependent oxidoreductase [candidate division Zixibacteria bacterium]|nr:NAD(P)/FAD-dependent oxidoreductase [candidate division Zixibacteria bacterium]
MKSIAVIGGGAAGYFGAIAATENNPNATVTLFESTNDPLNKVRISGGGRCNVTHACFEPSELIEKYPRGSNELRGSFTRFQPKDTIEWFESRGVKLKTESDGRMFPITDRSETIIECLQQSAEHAGVNTRLRTKITTIQNVSDENDHTHFELETLSGETVRFDFVLLTTGSSPYGTKLAESLGHTIIPPVPSLFTFKIKDPRVQDLAGVSFPDSTARLEIDKHKPFTQSGPILITHWGLSGPAVLKLSAWAARELHDASYQAALFVNWCDSETEASALTKISVFKEKFSKRTISANSPVDIPKRFWARLIELQGIDAEMTWANITKKQMSVIAQELTASKLAVSGRGIFKEEFVTCGGVALKEVDFRTMQSRIYPGLFFAGEILDIDGVTGGFNFQSAWTTSWLAGQALRGLCMAADA